MVILNNEQAFTYHPIIKYLPKRIRRYVSSIRFDDIEEIRLRKGRPLMLHSGSTGLFVNEKGLLSVKPQNIVSVTESDINEAVELISQSSLYAVEDSLKNGYITVDGGHRIGIAGTAVLKNGSIHTIKNISGLNYRLSREVYGCADLIVDSVIKGHKISNTLIVSPPGCGKTTLLRDLIRQISIKGIKVSVADERSEIGAVHNGFCGYDLGYSCDILEGAVKEECMPILLRSMAPQVIATDEIGTAKDIEIITKAIYSGVSVLATIHSDNREKLIKKNKEIAECFECIVTLSHKNGPGTIEEIYCAN